MYRLNKHGLSGTPWRKSEVSKNVTWASWFFPRYQTALHFHLQENGVYSISHFLGMRSNATVKSTSNRYKVCFLTIRYLVNSLHWIYSICCICSIRFFRSSESTSLLAFPDFNWQNDSGSYQCTAQKMRFTITDFFSNVTKSAVSCGCGRIYWRNPWWKTFFVQWWFLIIIRDW